MNKEVGELTTGRTRDVTMTPITLPSSEAVLDSLDSIIDSHDDGREKSEDLRLVVHAAQDQRMFQLVGGDRTSESVYLC